MKVDVECITKIEYNKLSDRVSILEGKQLSNDNEFLYSKEKMGELCKGLSRVSEKMVRVETILETLPKQVMNEINLNLYKKDGDMIINKSLEGRFGKWMIGITGLIAGSVIMKIAAPIWDLIITIQK